MGIRAFEADWHFFQQDTALPPNIGNLMDCLSMKFRDNVISLIADELSTGCLNLRHLDIGTNQLCSLKEPIGSLVQLRDIILSDIRSLMCFFQSFKK